MRRGRKAPDRPGHKVVMVDLAECERIALGIIEADDVPKELVDVKVKSMAWIIKSAWEMREGSERERISAWLKAKALETEELLNLAADRADPDVQQERRRAAHQVRAIVAVLGIMVGRNELPLRGEK